MNSAIKPGRLVLFIVICLALLASTYYVLGVADRKITRGLDIAGGLYVLLEAVETGDQAVDTDAIERAIAVIRMRVDELGVAEPIIAAQGSDRIRIELPELKEVERARELIGRTARLSFVGPDGREIVTGANLKRAVMERDPSGRIPNLISAWSLTRRGRSFAKATGEFLTSPSPSSWTVR